MPHRDRRAALLIAWFALALVALWSPVATAQPTAPPAAVTPTSTATVPVTPTATVTPTRTAADLLGVGQQPETLSDLWTRFGLMGLFVLVALALLLSLVEGIREWFKELGKQLVAQFVGAIKAPAARKAITTQRQSAEADYLAWVQAELRHLPIIPIRSTERQEQLLVEEVYVRLRVVERTQIEGFRKLVRGDFDPAGEYTLRQEAFEALENSRGVYRLLSDPDRLPQPNGEAPRTETTFTRLLLVGDAGSGKTTTLQYGVLVLAHAGSAGGLTTVSDMLDLHVARAPLPIYIRLTLVATYVRDAQKRARPDELPTLQGAPSRLLLEWLESYTRAQMEKSGQTLPVDLLARRLTNGDCLVLLDGLDETGDARERDYIQRLIANLVQDYGRNRFIVASRPFEELGLPGFEERHLSPLTGAEIEDLLRRWFSAVRKTPSRRTANETVDEQVGYLRGILDGNARLFEMATNPLLLTSMALLVHTGVGLPRERAELYSRLVYLLLETWRTQQTTGGVPGRDERFVRYGGEESVSGVQRRLQELAAWMQEHERRELRLREAQQVLRPVYRQLKGWHDEQTDDYVATLLESLALESGLIQRRDGGYSFAHFTLQEYLTARLYDLREDGVERLFAHWPKPRWRETILLAVGHWATGPRTARPRRRRSCWSSCWPSVRLAPRLAMPLCWRP